MKSYHSANKQFSIDAFRNWERHNRVFAIRSDNRGLSSGDFSTALTICMIQKQTYPEIYIPDLFLIPSQTKAFFLS